MTEQELEAMAGEVMVQAQAAMLALNDLAEQMKQEGHSPFAFLFACISCAAAVSVANKDSRETFKDIAAQAYDRTVFVQGASKLMQQEQA